LRSTETESESGPAIMLAQDVLKTAFLLKGWGVMSLQEDPVIENGQITFRVTFSAGDAVVFKINADLKRNGFTLEEALALKKLVFLGESGIF